MINSTYKTTLVTAIKNDIDYVAVTTNADKPTGQTQIVNENELCRVSVTPTISGNEITIPVTIPYNKYSATATINTVNSQKEFILDDSTGFNIGDLILINWSNLASPSDYTDAKITDISGNTITIEKNASITVTTSMSVVNVLNYLHVITGGSTSPNTGTTMLVVPLGIVKETNIIFECDIIMEGQGF